MDPLISHRFVHFINNGEGPEQCKVYMYNLFFLFFELSFIKY